MKTSGWSTALGTVLGIVLIGFFAAMIGTLFNKTPYASGPELPEADSGQQSPFAALRADDTPTSTVGGIRQARSLVSIAHPASADDRYLIPFTHPESIHFSVEHHLSMDSYNLKPENARTML
ncbi:MAG: hypothetical protein JO235_18980 [Chroococcidiopsidaceae cyanobacterium CP_BM_RX_35]|nr:hypothetical protein [Chroococcidiopsidaceae cyanobacterium CP_BM_RX_35]